MHTARLSRVVTILLSGFLMAACGGDDTPTTPSDLFRVTETFSGTLRQNDEIIHRITSLNLANVETEVVSLAPDPTALIGVGIGTPDGAACRLQALNNQVTQGNILISFVDPGTFCIQVSDPGNLGPNQSLDYVIEVRHQ